MNKKIIWTIVLIVIILILIGGAGIGTAYYLAQKNAATPSPSASTCTNCQSSSSAVSKEAQIKANHCLQSPNSGTENITVADLENYSEITSPIVFTGTANVFEGSFQVKLIDCENSKIIKQVIGQTEAGDVGQDNPYSVTITYDDSYAGHYAYIEVYDLSAKDGSVQDLIQVPVLLK
jgi:hypothetical protein